MNITNTVKVACLEMLASIADMKPELRDLQGQVMVELEKGPERNLASLLDELVRLSKQGVEISNKFQADIAQETAPEGHEENFKAAEALMIILHSGDVSQLNSLDPALADAIRNNIATKEELENDMDSKFGKHAMMQAINDDGLLADFLEKMDLVIQPDKTPDREAIEEFAKSVAIDAIEKARTDLSV